MTKNFYRLLFLAVLVALQACSVKKDSMKNRAYHNMTSWFNTLFNGKMAMDEKLQELKTGHKDDYFEVLRVEPYDEFVVNDNPTNVTLPEQNSGQAANFFNKAQSGNLLNNETSSYSGFEKAEEKALKVIANHSMMIRGKERNRLMERAYLMLGQARYYQGKPFQAMDALQYAQNLPFDKHKPEAKYYAALSQIQAGNKFAAAEMLDPMYNDGDLDKQMKADVAKQYAWLYYLENDLESALNGLDKAIEFTRSREEEARLNYIQGQLLTKLGRFDEANSKFDRSYKLKPGFEMEARSQVAAAMNFDPMVNNYSDYRHRLMKMYNTGTYETYRNEFLYALGKIEEKRDSLGLAEETYLRALKEKQSDARFRAETYAAMGDLKFRQSDYVYAGAYYDSAVTAITEGDRKIELTAFRDNLRAVMDKYYLVQRNDSILRLAAMPESERNKFFEDYIEELRKNDELKRQQEADEATEFLTQSKRSSFGSSFEDGSGKFYFYSDAAKSNGQNEFRRLWGDRQLRDNWRLSSVGTSVADQKAALTGTAGMSDPRRYELDFYMEQMPKGQVAIDRLKVERDTTELSLGLDYFDKFRDARLSTNTLEHLVSTPPKEEDVLLKAYYNLYRINKEKNTVLSEKYKNLVLENFPNTIYAEFILNPEQDFTEASSAEALALYDETYKAYKDEDYALVKEKASQAFMQFPLEEIVPKFAILNAYADARLEGADAYKGSLQRILVLYPGTEEATHAQNLLSLMDGKKDQPVEDEIPLGEIQENVRAEEISEPLKTPEMKGQDLKIEEGKIDNKIPQPTEGNPRTVQPPRPVNPNQGQGQQLQQNPQLQGQGMPPATQGVRKRQ